MGYTVKDIKSRGAEPATALLLSKLQKRAPTTYGEIARILQKELRLGSHKIFPTHIGHVAAGLMERILAADKGAPLINVLVVAQKDGRPGTGAYGFIERRHGWKKGTMKSMEPSRVRALVDAESTNVYDYRSWPALFERAFGHPFDKAKGERLDRLTEREGKRADWGGRAGGESPEHKRLKQYVHDNPGCVGVAKGEVLASNVEQPLLSGDTVDVFISTKKTSYVIEVKSIISSEGDFLRGIYQCLKYRVVYAAQQGKEFITTAVVPILVTERELPSDLTELATRFGVRTAHIKLE